MALIEGFLERIDGAIDGMFASLSRRRQNDDEDDLARRPSGNESPDNPLQPGGDAVVNGVVLPKVVADQLKKLGLSLSWYSKGELEAAISGCAVDCNLIDDPDGVSFFDDLILDEREKEEDDGDIDYDPYRLNKLPGKEGGVFAEPDEYKRSVYYDPTFRDKIKAEREREREKKKQSITGGDSKSEGKSEGMALHGV